MKKNELKKLYNRIKYLNSNELKELIIELLKENENLRKENIKDELTNIYNRKVLDNNIEYDVLVMCDIDNFKLINDTFGHIVGDKILQDIAQELTNILRNDDLLLRYGGDEFTILFKNCTAHSIKSKLEKFSKKIFETNGYSIPFTMSFGITENMDNKSIEEAIIEADQALYISKQQGKNMITIYNSNIKEKVL